ncbi:hypothetical protein [Legionella saoudiensis]|uniref:hypothetical protein n=1 Tax=Legionella saoudiensis TaxID=1750561 RepID=UPI0007319CB1|nr:hypothetical protein [Legionella saoudiensis]
MERNIRLRRVGLLCCAFSQNSAYYRAGWINKNTTLAKHQFWIVVQNNFLDMCVIEWMKLFGSYNAHHWRRIVIEDPEAFKTNMLLYCNLSSDDYEQYHKKMKSYRDQFVAHLDSELTMHIPDLTNAIKATEYYYEYIYSELPNTFKVDFPSNIIDFHNTCLLEAKEHFGK